MAAFLENGVVTRYAASGMDLVDLPIATEGLFFSFIGSRFDDRRVALVIEITEDTDVKDFEKAWHVIKQWRDAVQEHNGPWIHGGDSGFYFDLDMRHRDGTSYRKLALSVNETITEALREYDAFSRELSRSDFWTILHEGKYNPYSFEFADSLLRLCRPSMGSEERKDVLREAIERIKVGDAAFYDPEEPVTGRDVRERIRQWKLKWSDGG